MIYSPAILSSTKSMWIGKCYMEHVFVQKTFPISKWYRTYTENTSFFRNHFLSVLTWIMADQDRVNDTTICTGELGSIKFPYNTGIFILYSIATCHGAISVQPGSD